METYHKSSQASSQIIAQAGGGDEAEVQSQTLMQKGEPCEYIK